MKKFFSGTFGSILLLGIAGAAGYFGNVELQSYWGRQAIQDTGLEIHSLENALLKAKAENKKVFVDVSAVWCGTCRRLDSDVLADERVKKVLDEKYVFARLEYETEAGYKFLKERNTDGVPNLWLLDSNGEDIKRLRLTFDPVSFEEQLR
jgi:thiol:disulfide interchange protein